MSVIRFPDPRLVSGVGDGKGSASKSGPSEDGAAGWPDVTLAAIEALQVAFGALNRAPGFSQTYREAQGLMARAYEVLKSTLE